MQGIQIDITMHARKLECWCDLLAETADIVMQCIDPVTLCQTGLAAVSPPVRGTLARPFPPYLGNPLGKGLPYGAGPGKVRTSPGKAPYEGLAAPATRLSLSYKGKKRM
jgi:hypothetical protein